MNVGDRVIIKGENPREVYEIKHIYPNARTYHYPTHDIAVLVEVGKCAWTAIPKEELELAAKPGPKLVEKLQELSVRSPASGLISNILQGMRTTQITDLIEELVQRNFSIHISLHGDNKYCLQLSRMNPATEVEVVGNTVGIALLSAIEVCPDVSRRE